MLMFSLHNRILLWSLNTTSLVNDAVSRIKIRKFELKGIIRPKTFDFDIELSENHVVKGNNQGFNFRFGLHKKKPSCPSCIINQSKEISMTI